MHCTLGDSLMVEVRDLLAEDEIFEQRWSSFTHAEAVLVIDGAANL